MTACVQLSVGPGIQWKERWGGREKWGPQSSVPRMQVYSPLSLKVLDGGALTRRSVRAGASVEGMPEQLRAAQSQSELALVPRAA